MRDRWNAARANWKKCLRAKMCRRLFARVAATVRIICCEALDLEKIKAHPKIFVGYSDLTTLLTYFSDAAGLVTFHGPMVAKDWAHEDGVDLASWQAALAGRLRWELAVWARLPE